MIKRITFSDFRRELFLFLFLLIILFPLRGAITVNATVESGDVVTGYMNASNNLIITLTFNDVGTSDLTNYSNGQYLIYYQHAESGSVPTIDMTDNDGNGLLNDVEGSTQSAIMSAPWFGNLDFNNSGIKTITITLMKNF